MWKTSLLVIVALFLSSCVGKHVVKQKSLTTKTQSADLVFFSMGVSKDLDSNKIEILKRSEYGLPSVIKYYCPFSGVVPAQLSSVSQASQSTKRYEISNEQMKFTFPEKYSNGLFNPQYGLIINNIFFGQDTATVDTRGIQTFNTPNGAMGGMYGGVSQIKRDCIYADYLLWNYETESELSYGTIRHSYDLNTPIDTMLEGVIEEIFRKSPFKKDMRVETYY